jgi:hypothetical protein
MVEFLARLQGKTLTTKHFINKPKKDETEPGLPDGLFSNQKSQFG